MATERNETRDMRGFRSSRSVDHAIARLAERQHGVVAAWQLIALGLGQDAIHHRARTGRLRRLHRGVYAVGHACLSFEGEVMAALLAVGDGSVAGGPTALVLWKVRERRQGEPIYITVDRKVRRPHGVEVRRADVATEWSKRHGIRVLMPGPALLEAATILGAKDLRRAVNEALVQKRTSIPSLVALVARSGGSRGVGRLARVVATAHPTRSDLEDALVAFLDAWEFRGYETNAKVGPDEVDVLFRSSRLVIEADGGAYHDNPIARANDAAKQARVEAAGCRVVRVRWIDLTTHRRRTAERLQTAAGSKP